MALPIVLRSVIASQASEALHARVDVGDVDLALLRGGIALEDVAVRPAGSLPEHDASEPPLIGWKRFAVSMRWLPLFRKNVQLRSVELDSPRVAVDRLQDGDFNLMALIPASPPSAEPPPEEPESAEPGWGFGIDRFVLTDGGVRFRDLNFQNVEPVEAGLRGIEVTDIALRPGLYGEPARLRLGVKVDQGRLRLDARAQVRDDGGWNLDASLKAQRMPVHRTRVYVSDVGWTDLRGELNTALEYRLEMGGRNEVRGLVSLDDLTVQVGGLDRPALAWKRLAVRVDPIDLAGHVATVRDVDLSGVALLVEPTAEQPLPFLKLAGGTAPAKAAPAGAATTPESAPTTTLVAPEEPPTTTLAVPEEPTATTTPPTTLPVPDAAAAPAKATPPAEPDVPWRWSVAALRLSYSHVHVVGPTTPLDVGVRLRVRDLRGEGDAPAPIQLGLAVGDGTLGVEGGLRLTPLGFDGAVKIDRLSVPELLNAAGLPQAALVRKATLGCDLAAVVGSSAPTPGDVRVQGKVSLADLDLAGANAKDMTIAARTFDLTLDELLLQGPLAAQVGAPPSTGDLRVRGAIALAELLIVGPDPKEFSVGAKSLDVTIDELALPAVLATPSGTAAAPTKITLREIELDAPAVQMTRAPEGMLIPPFTTSPGAPAAAPAEQPTSAPTAAPPAEAPPPAPEPAPDAQVAPAAATAPEPPTPPGLDVVVQGLRLLDGRIVVTDRTVKPFYTGGLSPLNVELRDLHWPALAFDRLKLTATSLQKGKLEVTGSMTPDGGTFEVNGKELSLQPFNPYATHYSPYSIAKGRLSVKTKATFGKGRYKADTSFTLHDFDLGGQQGDSLFQQQFGIPLSMALALMRDLHGNIALDVPLEADEKGTTVGMGTIVAGALRSALMGALTSPLKLVGAVLGGGGAESLAPAPIAFLVGRDELAPKADEQVGTLAEFLAGRPGIAVTLETAPTAKDARWLAEQALLAELGAPQGVLGAIRNLPQRGARDRIRSALAERAQDEPGELEAEDAATLDEWLAARPAIAPEQLRELSTARLARVERLLEQQHGVDPGRVTHAEPPPEPADGDPNVRLTLGAAGGSG